MILLLFCLVFIIPLLHLFFINIVEHLHIAEHDQNFRSIAIPMKLKFLKYWENIPLIYSYAFILDLELR
jgi:hypothetical protein